MSCGNAVSLLIQADLAAEAYRLLRRGDGNFAGEDDPDAEVIAAGEALNGESETVVDFYQLVNGEPVHYRLYELIGGEWLSRADDDEVVTPAYLAEPLYASFDATDIIRERIALGLASETAAGNLRHISGEIPVLLAYPQIESVRLPLVTVILQSRRPEVRGMGELIIPDDFGRSESDMWSTFEGWMDRSTVQIAVWSKNHEGRLQVRDAVQRVLMLNMPVFEAAGMALPDLDERDDADFEQYNAPIYQSIFTFSCLHPAMVRSRFAAIDSVEVTIDADINQSDFAAIR